MSVSRAAAAGAALALSGLAVFGLQAVGSVASAATAPQPTTSNCPNPATNYPPGQCGTAPGQVSDDTPTPGKKVHVHSEGWQSNSDVGIEVHSKVVIVGTFRASSAGVVDADVTIPVGLSVGSHAIVVNGIAPNGTPRSVSIPITITAANAAAARGAAAPRSSVVSLPRTGAAIASFAGVGVVLVGVGSVVVASGRRRRISAA
jgi:hypothetical protein